VADDEYRKLPPHYDRCFGCGPAHPTGLHMEMAGSGMHVKGSFLVTEHHQGAPALAHGGLIAAAMDEAMGFLLWQLETLAVTARLEVDFRSPVPMGSRLDLEGEVERVSGRKIHARMTGSIDGKVVAEAKALFIKVDVGHFAPHAARVGATTPTYNP